MQCTYFVRSKFQKFLYFIDINMYCINLFILQEDDKPQDE